MNIKSFLQAYLDDLEYNVSSGVGNLNHITSGTPFFDTEEEAQEYIEELQTIIEGIEQ